MLGVRLAWSYLTMLRSNLLLLAAASLIACTSEQGPASPGVDATATVDAIEIDWYAGSVDDAFATAKATGKPVYLYWGAAWCPPCHAINVTVFNRPEFIERSRLFVPVYLDGDTENAQAYGEKFGVRGYPTMIVFDSSGVELTRIPGGIDLQAYASILDVALRQTSSATTLVANLDSKPGLLAANDCMLLAYYSWDQDTAILANQDAASAFRHMYEACPATLPVERSVLYFAWLDEALTADDGADLSAAERADALQQITALLGDDRLIRANIFTVLFAADDFVSTLTEAGSAERTDLLARYAAAYDRLAADESIYKRERIYTLIGRIGLERVDDDEAELSSGLQEQIRAMVRWANETTPSVYERQPIINALGNVLAEAGMDDVAKPLLLAELEKSQQPYYYMVELADIEQRAGNFDAAVEWLRQAYETSQGPATRFQWGNYYLAGLLEMQPDDVRLIQDTAVGLIEELQNSVGLYQRPKAQFTGMQDKIRNWSETHGRVAEMGDIRRAVLEVCASAKRQDESRAACSSFLESV
jgi:thioredoxin-related protein